MKLPAAPYYRNLQTAQEIKELFARYDFRDRIGHPLLLCCDFEELVEGYCKGIDESKKIPIEHALLCELYDAIKLLSPEGVRPASFLASAFYEKARQEGADSDFLTVLECWDILSDEEVLTMTRGFNSRMREVTHNEL